MCRDSSGKFITDKVILKSHDDSSLSYDNWCCDKTKKDDNINQPKHYTNHPSGVECIEIVEHFNFNLGCAIKYIWRAGLKDNQIDDLLKAEYYIKRELARLKAINNGNNTEMDILNKKRLEIL